MARNRAQILVTAAFHMRRFKHALSDIATLARALWEGLQVRHPFGYPVDLPQP